MKIIYYEGVPEIIGTDEGGIKKGVPTIISDRLGEQLMEHGTYKFKKAEEKAPLKKRRQLNGTD